jgi:TM2 domain-containing membrane protein YozV
MIKFIAFGFFISAFTLPIFGEGDSAYTFSPAAAKYNFDAIPKDPVASAFFSATIPGSGQIYNKEYLRGFITAATFYAGLFTAQAMVVRFEALNTDTIYFQETSPAGRPLDKVRQVFVPRDDDDMVGLPTKEKVILATSAVVAAGAYVFAVIDAYRGAKRYNNKIASNLSLAPAKKGLGALAVIDF